MSMMRRRIMMSKRAQQSGYITDGLAFHLDGIDIGNTEGSWVDLIGGLEFPFAAAGVHTNNYVYFDGTGKLQCATASYLNVGYKVGTIEVCVEIEKSGTSIIFWPGRKNYMGAVVNTSSRTATYGIANASDAIQSYTNLPIDSATRCISSNKDRVMVNLQNVQNPESYKWDWNSSNERAMLGQRGTWAQAVHIFKGKLYSVRVYNRLLSESEMLNNQEIDNERFNLGLTI